MSDKKVAFSGMSDEERIAVVERIFIIYPRLKEILKKVDESRRHAALMAEPSCLIVTGPSGAGKTTISRYFREKYPRRKREKGSVVPVLTAAIQCPASVKSLATGLLASLGDPIPDKGSTVSQTFRLYKLVKDCEVEIVILDEFQHIIDRDRRKVLNTAADWLKNFVNETGKPVILMGMPGADDILDSNDQLERRFSSRITLDPFGWGEKKQVEDFRKFLKLLDEKLPFDVGSQLSSWETALRIHYATNGVVGKIMALVRVATLKAIKDGKERITLDYLSKAYEEKWGIAERLRRGKNYLNPFEAATKDVDKGPPPSDPIDSPPSDTNSVGTLKMGKNGKGVSRVAEPKAAGSLDVADTDPSEPERKTA